MGRKPFGSSNASLFILENKNGVKLTLTDIGASVVGISVPAKGGDLDVALGYDDPQQYFDCKAFFGTSVGRVANRIGGAAFSLEGVEYKLEANDNGNTLHGGFSPYSNRIWETAKMDEAAGSVEFRLMSPDGDQGFPGKAEISVKYTLTEDNGIKIDYRAVSDKTTVFNLTNHAYFNLDGHDAGADAVASHFLWMGCDCFTESDGELITTGKILPVEGTPLDFRAGKRIGEDLGADSELLRLAEGYDHNFVINRPSLEKPAARLWSEKSGLEIQTFTDLPGLQFYSGNHMEEEKGKGGALYQYRGACCLETQFFPNTPNRPEFPSCVFKAGEPFVSTTIYRIIIK